MGVFLIAKEVLNARGAWINVLLHIGTAARRVRSVRNDIVIDIYFPIAQAYINIDELSVVDFTALKVYYIIDCW